MVRRTDAGRFGGAFVFPGGKVDPVDSGDLSVRVVTGAADAADHAWRAAAFRELAEEVALYVTDPPLPVPPSRLRGEAVFRHARDSGAVFPACLLTYVANWVTPREASVRFNTRFFVLVVEDDSFNPSPALDEVTEAEWIEPRTALIRWESGEWPMVLPTIKNLEYLTRGTTPAEIVAQAPSPGTISPVEPQLVMEDGQLVARLPGERGYSRTDTG